MEDELEVEEDIAAQLLRDRKATLQAGVTRLVERLSPGAIDLGQTCDEIVRRLFIMLNRSLKAADGIVCGSVGARP